MNYLQKLTNQLKNRLVSIILIGNLCLVGLWYVLDKVANQKLPVILASLIAFGFIESIILSMYLAKYSIQPTKALWQTVMHLAPHSDGISPPDPNKLSLGKELVTDLSNQIYQLINIAEKIETKDNEDKKDLKYEFVAQSLPVPLVVLDPEETIKYANKAMADYIGIDINEIIGKNVYMVLDMSFPSDDTFDNWLKTSKAGTVRDKRVWERVKLAVRDNHPSLIFDLAAYYNKDNPDKNETMLIMFDHTKLYSQEDQAISFMALSVHELRAPLTLLRGYIEVFKEELEGKNDKELDGFMDKMQSQAELLMAYVNNILNVARVDDDQLELRLHEENWSSILTSTIENLTLRAKVRGINITCKIDPSIPSVGIDRLSIQEVINNLVDNAIKYSGTSKEINIESKVGKDGLVETTVEDHGLGIPNSVLPNLFTKFYRDHHNRAQIGGTGLGLYLSKAIVKAHGGNLWVRSVEGKGSTFGFSIMPFSSLSAEAKASGNQELVRNAHGWIKNHSLYRR
jgi:signal transduction histidine kinase